MHDRTWKKTWINGEHRAVLEPQGVRVILGDVILTAIQVYAKKIKGTITNHHHMERYTVMILYLFRDSSPSCLARLII
jgi:hypothetical protein